MTTKTTALCGQSVCYINEFFLVNVWRCDFPSGDTNNQTASGWIVEPVGQVDKSCLDTRQCFNKRKDRDPGYCSMTTLIPVYLLCPYLSFQSISNMFIIFEIYNKAL